MAVGSSILHWSSPKLGNRRPERRDSWSTAIHANVSSPTAVLGNCSGHHIFLADHPAFYIYFHPLYFDNQQFLLDGWEEKWTKFIYFSTISLSFSCFFFFFFFYLFYLFGYGNLFMNIFSPSSKRILISYTCGQQKERKGVEGEWREKAGCVNKSRHKMNWFSPILGQLDARVETWSAQD